MASVFRKGGKANRSGNYLIAYFDHTGKRITKSARTSDLAAAKRIAAKIEADVALCREHVIDGGVEAISEQSQRPIESHLTDFRAKLQAGGRKSGYIKATIGYVRAMAEAAGWTTAGNISADGANRYASLLKERGKSARTIAAALSAAKAFVHWLAVNEKLRRDPLASVTKPDSSTDRRLERRMLLPDEWPWLRAATQNGPERFGTPGPERALLYALAIQTGLRSGELRSLTRGRLFLDGPDPYVTCKASQTKNAKDCRQYVRPDLAEELKRHVATKAPGAPAFDMPGPWYIAIMIRQDLEAARQNWLEAGRHDPGEYQRRTQSDFLAVTNHDGERLDFHSLRHSTGAWLALAGEYPKAIQRVMRHASITMTMDRYGHLLPGEERETVGSFPDMMGDGPELLQATGTTDATAEKTQQKAQHIAQQSGRETVRSGATGRNKTEATGESSDRDKPLRFANLRDTARPGATKRNDSLQSGPNVKKLIGVQMCKWQ